MTQGKGNPIAVGMGLQGWGESGGTKGVEQERDLFREKTMRCLRGEQGGQQGWLQKECQRQ